MKRNVLLLAVAVVAATFGFRLLGLALPIPGSGCTRVGEIAAMQIDNSAPVVIGRDGELERFGKFAEDDRDGAALPFVVPSAQPTITCTGIHGAVGLAIGWLIDPTYVATSDEVFTIPHGSNAIDGSFRPVLAAGESIRSIALTPYSQGIEIAVGRGPEAEPLSRSRTRFLVYARKARGQAKPIRSFTCATLRGAVDAISIDSNGLTYASTEGGQVAIFGANATGNVAPAELLDGAGTGLHPSSSPGSRGRRPLAFDFGGQLYAGDADTIVRFRFQWEDKTHRVPGIPSMSGRQDGLSLVQALATDEQGLVYAVSIDPATKARSLVIFRGFVILDGQKRFLTSMPI